MNIKCYLLQFEKYPLTDQTNYRNDENYYEFDALEDELPLYPDIVTNDIDKCSQDLNVSNHNLDFSQI